MFSGKNGLQGPQGKSKPQNKSKTQYKRIEHGRFRRVIQEVKAACSSCGGYHDEDTTEIITPKDPRLCIFLWKMPPAPTPPRSKNQARMLSGKRNGGRKSRKRVVRVVSNVSTVSVVSNVSTQLTIPSKRVFAKQPSTIRQPNDWVAMRVVKSSKSCIECNDSMMSLNRKIGNRPGRIVSFLYVQKKSVLYSIWFLRSEFRRMYGIAIPSDIIHYILHFAFSRAIIEQQCRRVDQFHSSCGCACHLRCLHTMIDRGQVACLKHGVVIP